MLALKGGSMMHSRGVSVRSAIETERVLNTLGTAYQFEGGTEYDP